MAHTNFSGLDRNRSANTEDLKAVTGTERDEPGKPTRKIQSDDNAAHAAAHDIEEIASQQGASQRGYTADGDENKTNRPAQFDPKHPGGRPEGDPRR